MKNLDKIIITGVCTIILGYFAFMGIKTKEYYDNRSVREQERVLLLKSIIQSTDSLKAQVRKNRQTIDSNGVIIKQIRNDEN